MERRYIAFISYRHLPLEMETAKKLHRRIERYVVPKDLRKNGAKKLGLVFRDQDELPISSDLSSNIEQALDRSEYLIVVCTPDTCKSRWVLREISYFLEHHDRDHVLAILAKGAPEEAFPPQLTELRSEDGALVGSVEPLAANIVAPSRRKRNRLFHTESLRLLAVLVGCPYDALYRREMRYRRRRWGAAAGLCGAVAAAFIAMLLNRNAQIRAQLEQSQINESKTLAALSENAFREGDYDGAIASALQALPGEEMDRPYVPEAEYALSRELGLYRTGEMAYTRSIEQETTITALVMAPSGAVLATGDDYGTLRCWDCATGALLWQRQFAAVLPLAFLPERGVLCLTEGGTLLCGLEKGESLWERSDLGILHLVALSPEGNLGLCHCTDLPGGRSEARVVDLCTGQDLRSTSLPGDAHRYALSGALSEDGARAALLLRNTGEALGTLLIWGEDSVTEADAGLPASPGAQAYRGVFADDGALLLACDNHDGDSWLRRYDPGQQWEQTFQTVLDTEKVDLSSDDNRQQLAAVALLDCTGDTVAVGVKRDLYLLSSSDGEIRWHKSLSGRLLAGKLYDNACLWLTLDDGTITFCTESGLFSSDMGIDCFRSGYDLTLAALGDAYSGNPPAALVSQTAPQRVSLVGTRENEQMVQVAAYSGTISHTSLIASPSGEGVFALCQYPAGRAAEGIFMDTAEGSTRENLPLEPLEDLSDPGLLSLTEDGLLITPSGVLDTADGDYSPFAMGQTVQAVSNPDRSGVIHTAWVEKGTRLHLLLDGTETETAPCPEGTWSALEMGGCGYVLLREREGRYALYSPQGEWSYPDLPVGEQTLLALGCASPLLACWDGASLTIRQLEQGGEIVAAELPPATSRLLFAEGDSLLVCCSETGVLSILDAAEGSLLHRSEHAGEQIHFVPRKAACRVWSAEDGHRLLLCYDDLSRTGPVTIVIDRDAWACVGVFEDVGVYLPRRNWVLCTRMLDGIYLSPLHSRQEIIDLARSLCGAE